MDIQRGPLISLAYFCQGKSMEELKQSLLHTTMELRKRDDQIIQLKTYLSEAIRERDEAQEKCRVLLMLHQQQFSGVSSIDDHEQQQQPRRGIDSNNGFSSSDCEESIVSSQQMNVFELVPDKPLPEKGKLLQAVMKAGPLLQTLLLAGPLPQWRHPPPPLESFEIPPVTISPAAPPPQLLHRDSLISGCSNNNTLDNCGRVNRKRGLCEYDDSPTETKYQRLVLP